MDSVDEDVALMLAFRSGDTRAFDQLFRRWSGPLLRYIDRMVRDRGTAEELVFLEQEGLIPFEQGSVDHVVGLHRLRLVEVLE